MGGMFRAFLPPNYTRKMTIGFIKLHRKILDWEWYNDINATRLFLHLLLTANFEDKKWRGVEVRRGQLITSINNLSKDTGLSTRQTRTALNKLKSSNELAIKATSQFTMLELINYGSYQDNKKESDKPTTSVLTNKGQTKDKPTTTTKEGKKIRSKEDNKEGVFDLPNFIDVENWNSFVQMRKEIKKPLTDSIAKGCIKTLTKFEDKKTGNANLSLDNSIAGGYQGLFEPKEDFNKPKSNLGWLNK
jgi:hypothetical protein